MQGKLLAFLMGLAVGGGLLLGHYIREGSPTVPAPARSPAPSPEFRELRYQKQLAAAQARIEQLEAKEELLRHELRELMSNLANAVPAAPAIPATITPSDASSGSGSETSREGETAEKMLKAALQQQVDSKMPALKLRLQLTDEQERKMRRFLEASYGVAADAAVPSPAGQTPPHGLGSSRGASANPVPAINDILTPAQQAEYHKYQAEERKTQAQMAAQSELAQLQQTLQLDASQQEQVYNALYKVTLKQITPAADDRATADDPELMFRAKEDAVRPILTPGQFQEYQKFINSQRQTVRAWMQSFTNESARKPGSANIPVIR